MIDATAELFATPRPPSPPLSWTASESQSERLVAELRSAAASDGWLGKAAVHHLEAPGKLLRGRLAMAACDALDAGGDRGVELAVACELLHNASLVHDDLQDQDELRRGRPTVWARFGAAMAVNLGDHLLARAIQRAGSVGADAERRCELVQLFTAATHATLLGQTEDVLAAGTREPCFARYERLARAKTAPLLALPVEGALVLAGQGPRARSTVREAMGAFGFAYQIQDDLIEVFGLKDRGGRASDLEFGRPNAVIAKHMERLEGVEKRLFESFLAAESAEPRDVEVWTQVLRMSPAAGDALDSFDAARREGRARISALEPALRDVLGFAAEQLFRPITRVRSLRAAVDTGDRYNA